MFNTTTYQQAKECGEITQEILAYPAQKVLIDKSGITLLESSVGGGIHHIIPTPTISNPQRKFRISQIFLAIYTISFVHTPTLPLNAK